MEIKKDLIESLFSNKIVYNILSDFSNKEQVTKIKNVFEKIYEPYLYVLIHTYDLEIYNFNYTNNIKMNNYCLLELENKEAFESFWNIETIRITRDISIYLLTEKITSKNEKEIKKILFKSKFEFTIGNYLDVCKVTFNKNIYQKEISDIIRILESEES